MTRKISKVQTHSLEHFFQILFFQGINKMAKMNLKEHSVSMTPAQIKKLQKGMTTLLKADQITGSGTKIFVTPMKHKKMTRAGAKKKGFKLSMSKAELDASPFALSGLDGMPDEKGGKIDIAKAIKKTGRKISEGYKKNVRDTPVGSAIRTGIKTAIVAGAPALVTSLGAPQLAPLASAIAKPLADVAIQKAGLGMGGNAVLQSNYSNFLNSMHPAQNPTLPPPDNSLPRYEKGGSFRAVGNTTRGRGVLGTPMFPALPQGDNSIPRMTGKGFRAI